MHYTKVKIITRDSQEDLEQAINQFLARPEVSVLRDIKYLYQPSYNYDAPDDSSGVTTHYDDFWSVLIIYAEQ
jgi:sporulation protein Cse60